MIFEHQVDIQKKISGIVKHDSEKFLEICTNIFIQQTLKNKEVTFDELKKKTYNPTPGLQMYKTSV